MRSRTRPYIVSLLLSRPPATAAFVIYCAAFVILVVGVLMFFKVGDLVEGWFEQNTRSIESLEAEAGLGVTFEESL